MFAGIFGLRQPIVAALAIVSCLLSACQGTTDSISVRSKLEYNGQNVALALSYLKQRYGRYPRNAAEANMQLLAPTSDILEADMLPSVPWGRQARLISPCSPLGGPKNPSPVGTNCGPGILSSAPSTCDSFGAMLYEGDETGKHFVVYVIGYTSTRKVPLIPLAGLLFYRIDYSGPAIVFKTYTDKDLIHERLSQN